MYKKLVYVGSIWSLLQHSILVITSVVTYSMVYPLKSLFEAIPSLPFSFIFSLIDFVFLFGVIGIIICIIVIFSVKKIKKPDLIRKRLSTILITIGIILFVMQIAAFLILLHFTGESITSPSYYPAGYTTVLNTESIIGGLFGMVPSVILIISGILAMKFNENLKSQPVIKPQNISCSNCNTIADSSNKFCKKCGNKI